MTSDMLLRLTPGRYEGLIRYAREAGLNALRSEGSQSGKQMNSTTFVMSMAYW